MKPTSQRVRAAVADQAADWYVQNRGGRADQETRAEFIAWLKASPMHVEEYLGIAVTARDLAAAAEDPEIHLESLLSEARGEAGNVVPLQRPASRHPPAPVLTHSWSVAVAAAAALIVVVSSVVWTMRDGAIFGLARSYSTAHGEQRVQQLPDGSVLHLNTDSKVTVHYSGRERVIDLVRGQALFEVAHESQRPFRVSAGSGGVVAVGTRFDVYRRVDTATVTVVDGAVAVYAGDRPRLTPTGLVLEGATRVEAGYQLEINGRRGVPRRVDARAVVAWLQRQIAFENRALGEVAADFNRYGPIPLEITDQRIRALPISGVFDAYDTDSFAAFLETLNGVVVQRTPTRIRVLSLASANREPLSVAR